jgi:CspA family cold shock protein
VPTGTVKRYFDERGFGFLKPDGAGEEVFFHVKSFDEQVEPHVGDRVEFELGADPKSGRTRGAKLDVDLSWFSGGVDCYLTVVFFSSSSSARIRSRTFSNRSGGISP